MKSKASVLGHPLHPIFVTIPIGLWSFSFVADLIYHLGLGGPSWKQTAFYCLGGGLVAAVPAIITGVIDYTGIASPSARRVATFHLVINLVLLPLYLISFWLRYNERAPGYSLTPVILSAIASLLLGISGWLGGELVSRYGVSVHTTPEKLEDV